VASDSLRKNCGNKTNNTSFYQVNSQATTKQFLLICALRWTTNEYEEFVVAQTYLKIWHISKVTRSLGSGLF
jgi:hypothetical protein